METTAPATAKVAASFTEAEMIQNSPSLGKIFDALAAAQGEMSDAVLDMENPHFKSKYASLKSVRNACKDALKKYKLSVNYQIFSVKDMFYCRTVLGHGESGEWMSTTFRLLIDKSNMQGLGSAISYAKRYSLAAMIGVVDSEDDDGNGAVAKPNGGGSNQPAAKEKTKEPPKNAAPAGPTQAMLKRLYAIGKSMGWEPLAIRTYCLTKVKRTPGQLSKPQYDKLCETLEHAPFDEMQAAEIEVMYENLNELDRKRVEGE